MTFEKISLRLRGMDCHTSELLLGAGTAFFLKVIGAGLSFGFNIVLARTLGAQGAGVFFIALTFITVAAMLGRVGLDNTLVKFIAGYSVTGDWALVKGVFWTSVFICLGASAIVTVVVFTSAGWVSNQLYDKPELFEPLQLMAWAIIPLAMSVLLANALKGCKKIFAATLTEGVAIGAFSLSVFLSISDLHSVKGAASTYLVASVCAVVLGACFWSRAKPELYGVRAQFSLEKIWKSCGPLLWVSCLNFSLLWSTTFFLGIWETSENIGVYNVAWRTSLLISFVLISVNSISGPKFAEFVQKNDIAALQCMAKKSSRLMTFCSLPLVLLFVFIPGKVLSLFGPEFVQGAILLSILSIAQVFNVITGPSAKFIHYVG
ncbi:MAG: oligosaccharide flippase family protein [Syntrophotaleaceae bacterium]